MAFDGPCSFVMIRCLKTVLKLIAFHDEKLQSARNTIQFELLADLAREHFKE